VLALRRGKEEEEMMLGDVVEVAKGLWLVEGEMPDDNDKDPDVANAVVYRRKDRLYVIDTGVGPRVRDSLLRVLRENGPVREFALLNSHAHPDHIRNNDLIHGVSAEAKRHYVSKPGMALLDAPAYFARHYALLGEYYDPLAGFRADRLKSPPARLKYRIAPLMRDALTPLLGREGAYGRIVPLGLRKFKPVRSSKETISFFETLPGQEFRIGSASWTGWVLGDDDVRVLEDRGHSPDHVCFYVPEHRFLYTGDSTYETFTIWPDSDGEAIRSSLGKCAAMARAGEVAVLADGHHHRTYRGRKEIVAFLEGILEGDRRFREVLLGTVRRQPGLTVPEVYARLEEMRHEPVVQKYLDLEFPHAPGTLQAIVVSTLLEMGCRATGPRGSKRFFPPPETDAVRAAERGAQPR
jgi:glyoxylase-like metal-dependent hydrolase (beta-lactamase superfamily II)